MPKPGTKRSSTKKKESKQKTGLSFTDVVQDAEAAEELAPNPKQGKHTRASARRGARDEPEENPAATQYFPGRVEELERALGITHKPQDDLTSVLVRAHTSAEREKRIEAKAKERKARPKRDRSMLVNETLAEDTHAISAVATRAGDAEAPTLADLVTPLVTAATPLEKEKQSVKKSLKRLARATEASIEPALPEHKVQEVERAKERQIINMEMRKWRPVVADVRRPNVEFPLHMARPATVARSANAIGKIGGSQTTVGRQVTDLLAAAGLVEKPVVPDGGEIETEEQYIALKEEYDKLTGKGEGPSKSRELAKLRMVMSAKQRKEAYVKNIKSKTYRRLLRKFKQKKEEKWMERLEQIDPKLAAIRRREKAEIQRIQERVTQKHKNNSKWARHMKEVAKSNKGARDALASGRQMAEKLLHRQQAGSRDDDEDDEDETEGKADDEENKQIDKLLEGGNSADLAAATSIIDALRAKVNEPLPATGIAALPFLQRAQERDRQKLLLDIDKFERGIAEATRNPEAFARAVQVGGKDKGVGKVLKQLGRQAVMAERLAEQEKEADELQARAAVDAPSLLAKVAKAGTTPIRTIQTAGQTKVAFGQTRELLLATTGQGKGKGSKGTTTSSAGALDEEGAGQAWAATAGVETAEETAEPAWGTDQSARRPKAAAAPATEAAEAEAAGGIALPDTLLDTSEPPAKRRKQRGQTRADTSEEAELEPAPAPAGEDSEHPAAGTAAPVLGKKAAKAAARAAQKTEQEQKAKAIAEKNADLVATADLLEVDDQEALITRAFAEDTSEIFAMQKHQRGLVDLPEVDRFGEGVMPGWGSWSSELPSKAEQLLAQRKEAREQHKQHILLQRPDLNLKHVIINTKQPLQVKAPALHLQRPPRKYTAAEWEKTIQTPLAPELNSAIANRMRLKPRVITKPGVAIRPIAEDNLPPEDAPQTTKRKSDLQNQQMLSNSGRGGAKRQRR
eukprot:TRINITY_DN8270_c0_g1_i1.p1 TRINITY_DN8270_c0_g1~~TRINITY_DN8270_c0_g1_i1.p1  ORF type:complete len:977 (-),score=254.43 TRINITY_DN8270_c0_g1_i1:137-3046(-)